MFLFNSRDERFCIGGHKTIFRDCGRNFLYWFCSTDQSDEQRIINILGFARKVNVMSKNMMANKEKQEKAQGDVKWINVYISKTESDQLREVYDSNPSDVGLELLHYLSEGTGLSIKHTAEGAVRCMLFRTMVEGKVLRNYGFSATAVEFGYAVAGALYKLRVFLDSPAEYLGEDLRDQDIR